MWHVECIQHMDGWMDGVCVYVVHVLSHVCCTCVFCGWEWKVCVLWVGMEGVWGGGRNKL